MIDLNCDVGEGLNNESLLMPYITSCNIACGGHAGDVKTMLTVVALAKKNNVKIGAHPSYPDRNNFGRMSINISKTNLKTAIIEQIELLKDVVERSGCSLSHIKAHGALYNDIAGREDLANTFLEGIERYREDCKLYVPYQSIIAKMAHTSNFNIVYEAFADRNYNDDLNLIPRNQPDAILTNINAIISHISLIKNEEMVKTLSGKLIPIKADTFCVHGDNQNAVEIVKKLHSEFCG